MPDLHSVTTSALWPYNTPADKVRYLLSQANLVDTPPTVLEVEQFAQLIFQHWAPTPKVQNAVALIVGTFNAATGFAGPCFLRDNTALAFVHFSRELIALQLLVRVINPVLMDQGTHSVCTVIAFLQGAAIEDPAGYVNYVAGLATGRDGTLSSGVGGGAALHVHIRKRSNILRKHAHHAAMPEADYIAAASLRDSANVLPYRAWWTNKMLQGASNGSNVRAWMQSAGFTNIQDHDHMLNPFWARGVGADARVYANLQAAHTQLNNGCTVILSMTRGGRLAWQALGQGATSSLFEDIFAGHSVLLRAVQFGAMAPGGNHPVSVALDIVSWKRESNSANLPQIPWDEIMSCYRGFVSGHA